MLARRLKLHQVDDIDDADLELWQMLAEDGHRGEDLERRRIAATGHHHVRLAALVIARPGPDSDALGAVHDRLIHRQPLRRRVLTGDDDVDVVAAARQWSKTDNRQLASGGR